MIYKKEDFKYCQFNPLLEGSLLKAYPKLKEIVDQDWQDEHLDKILRYIIMVYDPKSPLINERDLNRRKSIALELARIDDELLSEALITSVHIYFPDLTGKFLKKFVRSMEWAAICAVTTAYWESITEMMKPIHGKSSREILDAVQKKAAIKDEIVKDIERLNKLSSAFYGGDEELQARTRKKLTPETVANSR